MPRLLPLWWTGTGLLVTVLTCGCQHCCCCSECQPSATGTASPSAPVVHTAAKLNPANLARNQGLSPASAESPQDARTLSGERFGHDPNYRWLEGIIDYSRIQRAWLLRYVPFEEDDRYGGCVMLVGADSSLSLKPGQTVRVEGELIDPYSRHLRPAYQVQKLRVEGP